MSNAELQQEEIEVLRSIYDGDSCFIEVNSTTFQYKNELDENKSFLIELVWGTEYPTEIPNINLDAFFNNHLLDHVKADVISRLTEEAEPLLGCAMTYSLFEYAKENAVSLMEKQEAAPVRQESHERKEPDVKLEKVKKEQLTKAQKRKMTDRLDNKGERPRGWNWVDVIKHLSQTGRQQNE